MSSALLSAACRALGGYGAPVQCVQCACLLIPGSSPGALATARQLFASGGPGLWQLISGADPLVHDAPFLQRRSTITCQPAHALILHHLRLAPSPRHERSLPAAGLLPAQHGGGTSFWRWVYCSGRQGCNGEMRVLAAVPQPAACCGSRMLSSTSQHGSLRSFLAGLLMLVLTVTAGFSIVRPVREEVAG